MSQTPDTPAAAGIAETMLYVKLDGFGPPDVLKPDRMPVPKPEDGEILIKVASAGVNRPDVQQRLGQYNPPRGASPVPGLEVAGVVVARGNGAARFAIGERVCALVAGGGYAEYCLAPEVQALPVPSPLSLLEAGGVPETYFTVWTNVFDRGRLSPGETLLVHGGSSGIGTTAIQLAKAFGSRVFATAGSDEKCRACLDLGADAAINYAREDFKDRAMALTDGAGVDVILDMVGGDYVSRNLDVLALEGRLVQIAWLGGSKVSADFMKLMTRRLTWTGSTLRPRTIEQKAEIARALEAKVWPLLEAGTVKPIIHTTFPLARAADAHRLMESSAHIGKIMLTVE
ncbi:MAG: NAD(P)H-quinone oxidoreductase [Hyphomicrobiaceae bacterium]